jgi:hypothetical protein
MQYEPMKGRKSEGNTGPSEKEIMKGDSTEDEKGRT